LLEQVEQPDLRLFLAYWRSRHEQLPRELMRAGDDLYRRFCRTALELKLVRPLELLAPGKENAFLDLYLAVGGGDDIVDLAKKLLEIKEPACLVRLEDSVPRLSRKALRKLEKLASKYPETPVSFRRAVEKALAARPRKRGIAGLLQEVWERLPAGDD
jgi:hypothetical protein